jgi:3-oxoacyl-[acyl-carrier-protein] synthase II
MKSNGASGRIAVTAVGVISALGAGVEEFARNLHAGRTAAAPSARFGGVTAAEIADLNPQPWLGTKGIRALDRGARLLAIAAKMALDGAGFRPQDSETGDPDIGLVCGTVFSSLHSITAFDWSGLVEGPAWVNPTDFANTVINAPAGQAAIKHKLGGVNSTICAGQASGLFAIDYAADVLRFGRARAMLAGGVEELCEESLLGFAANREGVAPGEGAALLALESEEAAAARGCTPWLEVLGFGCCQDAHSINGFDVRAEGATEALRQALEKSAIVPEQVACIISSANGSRLGDEMEARALDRVFGKHLAQIPVCAPKAGFGEAMGAGGALCAVVAGVSLQHQEIPPTAGFANDFPRLRLSAASVPIAGEYALVNAFGCDGNNAALVMRLWER